MTNNDERFLLNIDTTYVKYDAIAKVEASKKEKYNSFKERIKVFATVETLEEAKAIAAKVIPTANETNRFYVGDAKCVVINKENMLRISLDSAEEFICYDFV